MTSSIFEVDATDLWFSVAIHIAIGALGLFVGEPRLVLMLLGVELVACIVLILGRMALRRPPAIRAMLKRTFGFLGSWI